MHNCFGFEIVYPPGEEARSAVSNHEATTALLILRDAAKTPLLKR